MSKILKESSDKFLADGSARRPVPAGRPISRKNLINAINRINFQDGDLTFNFRNPTHNNLISLSAKPQPCLDNELECQWTEQKDFPRNLQAYEFLNFFFSDGLSRVQVEADILMMSSKGLQLSLPDICYDVNSRKIRRHSCVGIQAQLSQDGLVLDGVLDDFSALAFSVDISGPHSCSPPWIEPAQQVMVLLRKNQEILYSGACEIVRIAQSQRKHLVILRPVAKRIQRFKPKEFRSIRQKLSPLPNFIFSHPFTGKKVVLRSVDLSGSGISAEEDYDNSLLLPGMIIADAGLQFADDFSIRCNRIQVLYRDIMDDGLVKCGLAILDMDVHDHVKLSSILYQAIDEKSNMCVNNIDLDALWDFFFETGFIYPDKYKFMKNQKKKYRDLYEKLYTQNLSIARHIIYQDKGVIYGHVSMFRFYEKSWILHHHAATHSKYQRAGLIVMEHILRYINEFHNLYSAKMNYIACYFRPNNKFANRVFGGAAKALKDPRKCSVDSFAYYHYRRKPVLEVPPVGWSLEAAAIEDLMELKLYYGNVSGGLMLQALDMEPELIDYDFEISKEYQRLALKRDRHLFSLKKDGCLKAVFMVNVSDLGLNMSDLTNCIHSFVLDSADLSKKILDYTLSLLVKYYEAQEVPILLFPSSYAETLAIRTHKIYNLEVLDLDHINPYLKFIETLLHYSTKEGSKRSVNN